MVNNMTANTHGLAPTTIVRTFKTRREWRHATLTQQQTLRDFARRMGWPVNEAQPDVPMVRAALRLPEHASHGIAVLGPLWPMRHGTPRLEFHHHSQARELAQSCPDLAERMTEIQTSVLAQAGPGGRNANHDSQEKSAKASLPERNAAAATID